MALNLPREDHYANRLARLSFALPNATNEAMVLDKLLRWKRLIIVSASFLLPPYSAMLAQTPLPIMPLPSHAVSASGTLSLNGGLRVSFEGYTEPRLERARDRFLAYLGAETGILPVPMQPGGLPTLLIKTTGPSAAVQQLDEDESYHLEVTTTGAAAPIRSASCTACRPFCNSSTSRRGFAVPPSPSTTSPASPGADSCSTSAATSCPSIVVRQTSTAWRPSSSTSSTGTSPTNQGFRVESKAFRCCRRKARRPLLHPG
jgi:hexosaminidase